MALGLLLVLLLPLLLLILVVAEPVAVLLVAAAADLESDFFLGTKVMVLCCSMVLGSRVCVRNPYPSL